MYRILTVLILVGLQLIGLVEPVSSTCTYHISHISTSAFQYTYVLIYNLYIYIYPHLHSAQAQIACFYIAVQTFPTQVTTSINARSVSSRSLFSPTIFIFFLNIYFILVVVGLYFRPAASISIPTLTTTDLCSILIANSSSNTYTYRANVRNVLLCHICCNKVRVSHQTFFTPHTLPPPRTLHSIHNSPTTNHSPPAPVLDRLRVLVPNSNALQHARRRLVASRRTWSVVKQGKSSWNFYRCDDNHVRGVGGRELGGLCTTRQAQ